MKSKVCARSKPKKPRNKAIRSVKRQAQSNKLKVVSSFLNEVNPFLQLDFKQKVKGQDMSANNATKSVNMKHAIKGGGPEQEINWDTILVADGELIKPENSGARREELKDTLCLDSSPVGPGAMRFPKVSIVAAF